MKEILKISGIFLSGLLVGGILMNLLYMRVLPTYREMIAIHLYSEEEYMAGRSRRNGNSLDTVFHRWAAVNAISDNGFRALRAKNKEMDENSFFLPFALISYKWVFPPENIKAGRHISEGFDRGKLAVALETIGQNEEAIRQWQLAAEISKLKDIERTKKSTYSGLDQEKTELYLKAERNVLGDQDKAQQTHQPDVQ